MIKKLIQILIIIIFFANFAFAEVKSTHIEYTNLPYAFDSDDESKFRNNANVYMLLYEKSQPGIEKANYLQEAMKNYFLLKKINNSSIDACIGLGRIYDEMKIDKLSLKYFSRAININSNNANANYYFGNYYFRRKEYAQAIYYYQIAYKNGLLGSFELNYKLGKIYEKLADIGTAKTYYSKAQTLYSKDTQLNDKIRLLDELNYGNSQYYLFEGSGKRENRDK